METSASHHTSKPEFKSELTHPNSKPHPPPTHTHSFSFVFLLIEKQSVRRFPFLRAAGSVSVPASLWLQRHSWCWTAHPLNPWSPAFPWTDPRSSPSARPAASSGPRPHASARWSGGCSGSAAAPRPSAAPPCSSSAAPAGRRLPQSRTRPGSRPRRCLGPGPGPQTLALALALALASTPFSCCSSSQGARYSSQASVKQISGRKGNHLASSRRVWSSVGVERIQMLGGKGWEMWQKPAEQHRDLSLSQLVRSLSSLQGVKLAVISSACAPVCTVCVCVCVCRFKCLCAQVSSHWHALSCNPFRAAILSDSLPCPDHCWLVWAAGGTSDYVVPALRPAYSLPDRLTSSLCVCLCVCVALTLACTHRYTLYNLLSILSDPSICLPFTQGRVKHKQFEGQ